jgi:5-methylthioadenosine/S-adenosylhomocysteine deaminase
MARTYQSRTVAYLEKIGFLSPRLLGAHAVHVNEDEIAILKRRDVGIAHCPQSNMKLSSGTAPIPQMLKAGIRLGLGTDAAASNNDLDLWEEIDTAAKLHKLIANDPTVVSASQAFEMATLGGARSLHMEKDIGSLEPGKRADLIIIDLDAPHLTPMYNIYTHLVYSTKSSDVTDTIVNGRVLMRNRGLLSLDEAAIKAAARQYQIRISRSLKAGK